MTKFLNKKQQVYDLKLTNYGHYLLSIGKLEPVYYSFLDDNILYDNQYAGGTEQQNDTVPRIQDETQYLESLVTFQDADNQINTLNESNNGQVFFEVDVEPRRIQPRVDTLAYGAMIGDAYLDGDTQNAPAWKIVALEGSISSSSRMNEVDTFSEHIPQLNIDVNYTKEIHESDSDLILINQDFRDQLTTTLPFADDRVIKLKREDLMVYGDEINTELLTENFDIEVFYVEPDAYLRGPQEDCVDGVVASLPGTPSGGFRFSAATDIGDGYNFSFVIYEEDLIDGAWGDNANIAINEYGAFVCTFYICEYATFNAAMADVSAWTSPSHRIIMIHHNNNNVPMRDRIIGAINGSTEWGNVVFDSNGPLQNVKASVGSATATIDLETTSPVFSQGNGLYFVPSYPLGSPLPPTPIEDELHGVVDMGAFAFSPDPATQPLTGGVDAILCPKEPALRRKYFSNNDQSIKGGMMRVFETSQGEKMAVIKDHTPVTALDEEPDTNSVDYYFNILLDGDVPAKQACKAASVFNKNSYYVDLDFECDKIDDLDPLDVDIYGKVTEPEICL